MCNNAIFKDLEIPSCKDLIQGLFCSKYSSMYRFLLLWPRNEAFLIIGWCHFSNWSRYDFFNFWKNKLIHAIKHVIFYKMSGLENQNGVVRSNFEELWSFMYINSSSKYLFSKKWLFLYFVVTDFISKLFWLSNDQNSVMSNVFLTQKWPKRPKQEFS